MWTLAVLTAGASALAIDGNDPGTTLRTPPPPPPTSTTQPLVLPASDTVRVGGVVGAIEVTGRPTDSIELPVTFTSAERGAGNGAEIGGVLVGEDVATIVWDAGRPLVISGGGSFAFDEISLVLVDGRLTAAVGGTRPSVLPGTFDIDTPVAVGRQGLAEPRDQVTFTVGATEAPTAEFRGDITIELPMAPLTITGPGSLTLEGSFSSVQPNGTEIDVRRVRVEPGDRFEISLAPFEGGWIVDGTVAAGSLDP